MANEWSFWIDVGGTFTDCLSLDSEGNLRTHKLLSTGVYCGRVAAGSTPRVIIDPQRCNDPPRIFESQDESYAYRLTLLSHENDAASMARPLDDQSVTIREFDNRRGRLALAQPLPVVPREGSVYALASGEAAPVVGVRWLMGKRVDENVGRVSVRLGTTFGTNALLQHRGARMAYVTTAGFADSLRIGYQDRPKLFALHIRKPTPLYETVVELHERLDAQGRVLERLDRNEVVKKLAPLRDAGIEALAVCLMHAYRNDTHERLVESVARRLGFSHVSISSRISPLPRIVSRGETTVVDAYLTPVVQRYVDAIAARLPEASIRIMTSAGGLVDAAAFSGRDSILSGPAGGVVGCARVAGRAGFDRAIGFDMGGTSTDVSRFDGDYERRYEMNVGDPDTGAAVHIVAPMLAIETVAAGGGSICRFDGALPRVGPESAGADPGPACYGRGGPLTVTDVNLFLGKLQPAHFSLPLDRAVVIKRIDKLIEDMAAAGQTYSRETLAEGFTRIANANMAAAIKRISIARGYDPRVYTLVAFGGAGGQHACAVARELGIATVLLHPHAGVLSALGIGLADVTRFAVRHVGHDFEAQALDGLEDVFVTMEQELHASLVAEGVPIEQIQPPRRRLDLRFRGMAHVLTVDLDRAIDPLDEFRRRFRAQFGFDRDQPVEIVAARVELTGRTPKPSFVRTPARSRRPTSAHTTQTFFRDAYHETAVFARSDLRPGDRIDGPAIITESIGTIIVEPGWHAEMIETADIILRDGPCRKRRRRVTTKCDLVTLELFNRHFSSVAEQMGAMLQTTALSTNVKERLDFSCAVFTAQGDLVVNAPHIPVHLGAMSECVKCLLEDVDTMQPGEVYVTNDPFRGGSHLPDVTVITPVFNTDETTLLFFTASRAHHAEIGGITPGSMPPHATNLAEEGVLIRAMRLVADSRSADDALRKRLASGPYPSRAVDENLADIHAQVAANRKGAQLLLEMVHRHGLRVVQAYMKHIQRAAERKVRLALRRQRAGIHKFEDVLDDGSRIRLAIRIRHYGPENARAEFDFAGTDGVVPGSLNANRAIVSSAVLYCLRCLIDDDIPLNAGVLTPVRLRIPDDCLLNPRPHVDPRRCPAVGGGNVETSQRIVDVIFGALGVVAASQGTMNNVLFGRSDGPDARGFAYYETIGGGSGAGPTFDGAAAVHTHMTNTRLTDPEIVELRYPVRVRRFAVRESSGGVGRHHGGDGIHRELEFLTTLEVSLLTSRRVCGPYGLAGGGDGQTGRNLVRRAATGETESIGSMASFRVVAGDLLIVETPGGGGFGPPA